MSLESVWRRRAPFLLAALAAPACGGDAGDPAGPGPAPRLAVSPSSITATALGETLSVQVTLGGQPAAGVAFSVRTESRWLDDRAVLDGAELASGRLVTRAPGRVVVGVSAGAASDSVVVSVVPARPAVVDVQLPGGRRHLGSSDTLVLRGYRMDQLTAANVGAPPPAAVLLAGDSANRRVVLPDVDPGPGCGGAAPGFTLSFPGVDGQPETGLTRRRTGEVALEPGGARRLATAEADCLRLAPAADAAYLLAYADGRLAAKAETGPEWPWPDSIRVTVADRTTAAALPARPPLMAARPAAEAALQRAHADGHAYAMRNAAAVPAECPLANIFAPHCRATPWSLGEVYTHYPQGGRSPGPARVVAVRGNLVLAVFLADSALLAPNAIVRADTALQYLAERGVPLLESYYGVSAATTSDASGQLLLVLEDVGGSGASWWPDAARGHGEWARVTLHIRNSAFDRPATTSNAALSIMGHEVLHAYQFRWRWQHAGPWFGVLGTLWAVEGSATYFQNEIVRDRVGLEFLGNATWPTGNEDSPYWPLTYGYPVTDLTAGYLNGASFIRDQVQRLMTDGGLSFDDASREVLRGVMEGWHGINEEGRAAGPGLTARMRQWLGPGWNPMDALLDWTMSQAADDRTSNPRFQNLTVRSNPTAPAMIRPHGTLSAGQAQTVARPAGTTGVFEIRDAAGGSWTMSATAAGAPAGPGWLLLRLR